MSLTDYETVVQFASEQHLLRDYTSLSESMMISAQDIADRQQRCVSAAVALVLTRITNFHNEHKWAHVHRSKPTNRRYYNKSVETATSTASLAELRRDMLPNIKTQVERAYDRINDQNALVAVCGVPRINKKMSDDEIIASWLLVIKRNQ